MESLITQNGEEEVNMLQWICCMHLSLVIFMIALLELGAISRTPNLAIGSVSKSSSPIPICFISVYFVGLSLPQGDSLWMQRRV